MISSEARARGVLCLVIGVGVLGLVGESCQSSSPSCGGDLCASTANSGGATATAGTGKSASSKASASAESTGAGAGGGWNEIPVLSSTPGCEASASLATPASWPKPAWESCGAYCQAAPAEVLPGAIGDREASAAAVYGGNLYYRSSVGVVAEQRHYDVLRRLSDDTALYVMRAPAGCDSAPSKDGVPLLFERSGQDVTARWAARFDLPTATLRAPNALTHFPAYSLSWFTTDGGWGVALNAGAVMAVLDTDPSNPITLYAGGTQDNTHAEGSLVTWVDWKLFPGRVRRWTPTDGAQLLFQAPNDVASIALSDTTMAFINVTGPNTQIGAYVAASVDWLDLTSDPASVVIHQGPDISGSLQGTVHSATAGPYVAVRYGPPNSTPDQWGIQIIDLTASKRWLVLPPPNTFFTLAGLSTTDLLVYETDAPPNQPIDGGGFQRWKRFDMTHLDDFATAIP